jgi:hypothetical protein
VQDRGLHVARGPAAPAPTIMETAW